MLYVYCGTKCCMCTVGQNAVRVLWEKLLYAYCVGMNCCMCPVGQTTVCVEQTAVCIISGTNC